MMGEHQSVLLFEAIEGLAIKPSGIYIDGTYGRGGHSQAILKCLDTEGRLIAFDKDPHAYAHGLELAERDSRFEICHAAFSELLEVSTQMNICGKVDGILLDLGVSSPQLDEAERGFSFGKDGPLDMRMDTTRGQSAAQWLAVATADDITKVLREYGEERFAKRIANAIVEKRKIKPLQTTQELVELIKESVPKVERHKHPATRTFQAIRIYINNELEQIKQILDQALTVLANGGRLVVISFHSLEDRIVKRFMRQHSQSSVPTKVPLTTSQLQLRFKRIGKAIKASSAEVAANARARSAIMRVGEKIQ